MRSHSVSRLFLAVLLLCVAFSGLSAHATAPTPWGGSPIPVTASGPTTVPATGYDLGGEGVAYHDINNGGQTAYRSDNIGVPGASIFGWAYAGEWEGYTLSVAQAGAYTLTIHANNSAHNGTCHLEFGPVGQAGGAGVTVSPSFLIPYTGGTVGAVQVRGVTLSAGTQWMRLVMDANGDAGYVGNFADITLTPEAPGPRNPVSATATTRVEAEDYDAGGEGVGYHDLDNGGQTDYRADNVGVYEESNASGGHAVGWCAAGEWDRYTLTVSQAGSYGLTARVSASASGGRFHLEFGPAGGAATVSTAEFTVPYATGGPYYEDVSVPAVTLPAGQVWMRLVVDDAYPCNFDFFRLTPGVLLPTATSLTLSPSTVANGGSVGGIVTLSGPALGTMALALSSDSPSAQAPAFVTVYAGSTQGYFTVTTSPVTSAATAHVTASGAGSPVTGSLTLLPAVSLMGLYVYSYTDDDGSLVGYGYVQLNGPAPAGGLAVSLGSDSASATVPQSVTVPAGNTFGSFLITVSAVSSPVTAHITASAGGVTKEADLRLAPFGLAGLSVSPDTVHGGDPANGYVYLNGPAPAGGLTFSLGSDSPLATVPASVTVGEGDDEAYFPISTSAVSSATPVHITAGGTGGPLTATLTLSPLSAPSGLTATAYPTGPATVVVNLDWAAAAGATGYVLERSHDLSAWTQVAAPSGTSYQDTPPSGTYFYYRVKATGGTTYSNLAYANTGFPWLVATDLAWTPDPVHVGDQVHFYAVIQNIGTATSQPFSWTVEFEGDAYAGYNIEANPLAPGDTLLVTEQYNQWWTATPGVHHPTVVIDDSYESLTRTLTVVPAAPTGLTATAVSSSEIDLAWGAVGDATGYAVERSPNGATGWTQIATPTGTAYADTGLSANTTYYYQVVATDAGGGSYPSNVAGATTQANLLDTMSYFTTIRNTNWTCASYGGMRGTFRGQIVGPGTGTLTLTGVTGNVTHAYLYWHGPTNSTDPAANATVSFAGHTVTGTNIGVSADNFWGFQNSQAYRADVTALVGGNGVYDLADFLKIAADGSIIADISGVSLMVFSDGDPAHYRDVTIYNGNDSNMDYSAPDYAGSWAETFDNISYLGGDATLYMGVSDGQIAPEAEVDINGAMLMPDGNNFDGDSVPNGPSVFIDQGGLWDVKGYALAPFLHAGSNTLHLTSGCEDDYLSLIYAVIDQPSAGASQGPPRPMNLTAVAGDTLATLSWSPVAGATYTLSRAISAAGPFQAVATGLTATTFVNRGLTDGPTYYYVVTASDAFGTSAASNIASATPAPGPGDFTISLSPGSLALAPGNSGHSNIRLTPTGGFRSVVGLSVTGPSGILGPASDPTKIAATLAPVSVSLGDSNAVSVISSVLTVAVGAQVPTGTYTLQVTSTDASGTRIHSQSLVVSVGISNGLHITGVSLDKYAGKIGDTGVGTVTIDGFAPSGGTQVILSSDNSSLNVPTVVNLPAGTNTANFNYSIGVVSEVVRTTLSAALNGTATTQLRLFPAFGLCAIATGQTLLGNAKITLYWNGTDSAVSYNIYRATAIDGTYSRIATGVNPVDNGLGVTNGFMYTDSDSILVPGTEYYYYVVAVENGAGSEGNRSNEASAVVDLTAIPWDTGNPSVIVPQVNAMLEGSFTENTNSVGVLVIAGPDGVTYQGNYPFGGPPQALPALWQYNAASNELVYFDGTIIPAPPSDPDVTPDDAPSFGSAQGTKNYDTLNLNKFFLRPALVSQLNFTYPARQPGPSGIYRRVDSQPGFTAVSSFISLPDPTENNPWYHSSAYLASVNDVGYIYSGGNVYRNKTLIGDLDAGLQLGNTNNDIGWKPFILQKAARLQSVALGNPINVNANIGHVLSEVMPDQSELFEFEAPGYGAMRDNTVALHIEGRILVSYLDPITNTAQHRVPCSAVTYVYSGINDWTKRSSDIIKRTNSIAQDFNGGYLLADANGPGGGFHKDQSFIYGAAWGTLDPDYDFVFGTYLLPGQEWYSDRTYRAGSYPSAALGYVDWTSLDDLSDEEGINLRNDTSIPLPLF